MKHLKNVHTSKLVFLFVQTDYNLREEDNKKSESNITKYSINLFSRKFPDNFLISWKRRKALGNYFQDNIRF